MAIMTKRERVIRTICFEETDRIPLYDLMMNDAIIEHYTEKRLTPANGKRLQCLCIGRTLDMARAITGVSEPGDKVAENGIRYRVERWTYWVTERPWRDTVGLLEWIKGEIKRTNALTFDRTYAETFHNSIRQHVAVFSEGDPTARYDPTVFVVESEVGLTGMYTSVGLETFCYLMVDYPDLIEEWLDARHRAELRKVASIASPGLILVALTYDDIAHKTGPIFSPAWLRQHWMPRLKTLNNAWHSRDTYCLFHSDGNLYPLLDDLVAAGIDGLNPIEVLAGMSVKGVRERYPRLFLAGGIDVSQLLCNGSPEEVRAACRQAIADAGGRGYFLGSTTELGQAVTLENAIAMFESAWNTATLEQVEPVQSRDSSCEATELVCPGK